MKTLKLNNPEMRVYVKSMNRLFRVLAICKTDDEANEVMRKNPEMTCIANDATGLVYLAEKYSSVCTSKEIMDKL